MLKNRQYQLSPDAQQELWSILEKQVGKGNQNEGNARLVRNLIEKAIRRQAVRLVKRPRLTREELMTIRPEDLN